jgi:tetratricopeptide (TPR) repeat protein
VFTLEDYRRFVSDPAFTKAQEVLRWCLRDAHERGGYLELLEPRPEAEVVCDLARLSLYQGAPEQAQTYLEQALGLDQAYWEAWRGRPPAGPGRRPPPPTASYRQIGAG